MTSCPRAFALAPLPGSSSRRPAMASPVLVGCSAFATSQEALCDPWAPLPRHFLQRKRHSLELCSLPVWLLCLPSDNVGRALSHHTPCLARGGQSVHTGGANSGCSFPVRAVYPPVTTEEAPAALGICNNPREPRTGPRAAVGGPLVQHSLPSNQLSNRNLPVASEKRALIQEPE